MTNIETNRIKVDFAVTRRMDKWHAEQLGKDKSTISKWCSNSRQQSIENLHKITLALGIDIRELLNLTKSINE